MQRTKSIHINILNIEMESKYELEEIWGLKQLQEKLSWN